LQWKNEVHEPMMVRGWEKTRGSKILDLVKSWIITKVKAGKSRRLPRKIESGRGRQAKLPNTWDYTFLMWRNWNPSHERLLETHMATKH